MKRAILVGLGTVAGTVAVLGYHPGTWFSAAPAAQAASLGSDSATAAQPVSDAAAAPAAPETKTYRGKGVDTGYGAVQVEVTVQGGQIVSVTGAQQAVDGKSRQIASYALPQLEQQATAAQTANVDGVSGASYTSEGFRQSMQSALKKAGISA